MKRATGWMCRCNSYERKTLVSLSSDYVSARRTTDPQMDTLIHIWYSTPFRRFICPTQAKRNGHSHHIRSSTPFSFKHFNSSIVLLYFYSQRTHGCRIRQWEAYHVVNSASTSAVGFKISCDYIRGKVLYFQLLRSSKRKMLPKRKFDFAFSRSYFAPCQSLMGKKRILKHFVNCRALVPLESRGNTGTANKNPNVLVVRMIFAPTATYLVQFRAASDWPCCSVREKRRRDVQSMWY